MVPGTMAAPLNVSLSSTLLVLPPVAGAIGAAVKSSLAATSEVLLTTSDTVAVAQTVAAGAGRHNW